MELEQVDRHLQAAGGNADFSPIYKEFLLTICHSRLGNDATARKWYEAGQVDVRNLLKPDQAASPAASTTPWHSQLIIRLLQEEAERLLNTSASTRTPSR